VKTGNRGKKKEEKPTKRTSTFSRYHVILGCECDTSGRQTGHGGGKGKRKHPWGGGWYPGCKKRRRLEVGGAGQEGREKKKAVKRTTRSVNPR